MVLGKVLGGTALAMLQGGLFLVDALTSSLLDALARGEMPGVRDTLTGLLRDALELSQQPELLPAASGLSNQLRDVIRQLSETDGDCRPEAGQ